MNFYFFVKHFHFLFIFLSLFFYIISFSFKIRQVQPATKILVIAPHIANTFLLISGITLCFLVNQYPGASGWFSSKLLAIFGYIFLAVLSLRSKRGRFFKVFCFLGAISWLIAAFKFAVFKVSFFN